MEVKGNNTNNINYPLRKENILSAFCNQFEPMWSDFATFGFSPFKHMYTSCWMHSRQKIQVKNDNDTKTMIIQGVDDNGMLVATDINDNNTLYTLHPDGNSLDLMKGMIYRKQ
ncbi:hypothetical protein RFI_04924 [Reticulomyxa filosa]|uniref:Biotin protein ligase C-terminal domain-containing protein n=1 Tax=Reticulomyxa filosa TaxID=46433 RepID=X6P229_RETFI|nr:hypothetical protein RFI_04924 [Reticulomyxa filosa]|eukprot:ETO32193.1 hypothetical protein RFI_04924 [Reticulomyxa filosa]